MYQKKKWEKAVEYLNVIIELNQDNVLNDTTLSFIQTAKTISDEHLPQNHIEKAKVYQFQGKAYIELGYQDSAIFYLEKASTIFDHLQVWERKAWVMIMLGVSHYYREDYTQMETYLSQVEKIVHQYQLSPTILDTMYELLGVLYFTIRKDYEKAIKVSFRSLDKLLKLNKKSYNDSLFIANLYNNIGVYYGKMNNLSRASYYYKLCLELTNNMTMPEFDRVEILTNYGNILELFGKHTDALFFYKKALHYNANQPHSHKRYNAYIQINKHLGQIYTRLNDLDSAVHYIDESIKLSNENGISSTSPKIFKGEILFKSNQLKAASHILQQALLAPDFCNEPERLVKAQKTYNTLGKIHLAQKDYDTALQNFQKALAANIPDFKDTADFNQPATITKAHRLDYLIATLENKAQAFKAINTPKSIQQAFQTYQLAIQWAEKMRKDFAFEASKVRLNEKTTQLYKQAIEIAYQLYQSTQETQYINTAFTIAEKYKSILLLESLIDEKGKQHYGVPTCLLERERHLKNNIAFYQQKKLETLEDSVKYTRYDYYHATYNLQLANLKDTLKIYYQGYFDLEYQNTIATIPAIQSQLLQPKQALIQYLATDSSLYVFTIEKDKHHFIMLPYGQNEKWTLQRFQHALSHYQSNKKQTIEAFAPLAHQVYEAFFVPAAQQLSADLVDLVIVPDHQLNYLPFETLLYKTIDKSQANFIQLPYLLKRYQFHYGYSGTLLLENKKRQSTIKTNNKCLAFAPLYKETNQPLKEAIANLRDNTVPLEGTVKEVKAIAHYFDGVFDCSVSATEGNFKKQVHNYGIIHLATHGNSNLEQPDFGHLVFSNMGKDTVEDGLLHQYEIGMLQTNAQLAVLSACETGVGKTYEGEGVMSLGRGFMYAGVPSIVMSLWKMNDRSSSELIPLFYKNLAKGMPKDEALHKAKLSYLDNARAEHAHPYYWAGFIGLGDTQPIKQNSFWDWKAISLGLLGLGLLFLGIWIYNFFIPNLPKPVLPT